MSFHGPFVLDRVYTVVSFDGVFPGIFLVLQPVHAPGSAWVRVYTCHQSGTHVSVRERSALLPLPRCGAVPYIWRRPSWRWRAERAGQTRSSWMFISAAACLICCRLVRSCAVDQVKSQTHFTDSCFFFFSFFPLAGLMSLWNVWFGWVGSRCNIWFDI